MVVELCIVSAVTVAEHTSICTVYDFTVHPVSVHLPLTRLLASLYILLDEPVEVILIFVDLCFLFVTHMHTDLLTATFTCIDLCQKLI